MPFVRFTKSVLRLLSPVVVGTDLAVSWQSVLDRNYFLDRRTDLSPSAPFQRLVTGVAGSPGVTIYTNQNAASATSYFYRVGVE